MSMIQGVYCWQDEVPATLKDLVNRLTERKEEYIKLIGRLEDNASFISDLEIQIKKKEEEDE